MNILSYIHIQRLVNPTGVGRVVDQLIRTHARLFPEIEYRILVDKGKRQASLDQLDVFWREEPFIALPRAGSLQQARWVLLGSPHAEDYWPDADIAYCPAESFVPVRKSKLVCTIHDVADFEEDLYPASLQRTWKRLKWSALFRCMVRAADKVVTVSEFSASRIARFFPGLEGKLCVVPNAPHPCFGMDPGHQVDASIAALTQGAPYILLPGGLSFRKNAELVFRAMPLLQERLPDIRIVVTGGNASEYSQRIGASCAPSVVLAGYVSDELLNGLYARADVVWFPSRYEGFGMPVVEAMAAGAPVVASKASCIPEVAGSAAVLCDVDSPEEHTEAIIRLFESPGLADEARRASMENATRFSWEASARRLQNMFAAL